MKADIHKRTRVIVTVEDMVNALRYYGYNLPNGNPVIDANVNKPGKLQQISLEWNEPRTENLNAVRDEPA